MSRLVDKLFSNVLKLTEYAMISCVMLVSICDKRGRVERAVIHGFDRKHRKSQKADIE